MTNEKSGAVGSQATMNANATQAKGGRTTQRNGMIRTTTAVLVTGTERTLGTATMGETPTTILALSSTPPY